MPLDNLQPLFGDIFSKNEKIILAGPCATENRAQTLDTARMLHHSGIKVFRAGVWKPRTKPGGFEGVGEPALAWLAEVKALGMATLTEVATPEHLMLAVDAGIDAVWIGARTSANPFAVQQIADAIASLPAQTRERLTVIVKNPVNPDLELWLGALQRIYDAGIRRLGAVHRGFSYYGKNVYRNAPQWRVPIELHRREPELPIICDPSHIGGSRQLIEPLAQQALDMRFDGLIIESHINPDAALSDAAQQITPRELAGILSRLTLPQPDAPEPDNRLIALRSQIDALDDDLLDILARRMAVSREIGRYKQQQRIPVVQPKRYNDLMEKRVETAAKLGLDNDFVRTILAAIHEESVRCQLDRND